MELKNVLGYKTRTALLGLLACLLLAPSCTKEDEPDLSEEGTNEWIYKNMTYYYLWNEDIPAKDNLNFSQSPEAFFASLLSDQDRVRFGKDWYIFSRIEKKRTETKSIDEYDSYGFNLATYKEDNSPFYYAWVLYVLPGSPADEAGLMRGDWIMAIDGTSPNVTNTSAFMKGGATTFQLAQYENGKFIPDRTIRIAASRAVADTPFLKDTVYTINGTKIGYMVYNTFASGPDNKDDSYDKQMASLFAKFKSQQVKEFVLDLRYNQGGLVTSANLLTSYLAPAKDLGKTFCTMEYNKEYGKDNEGGKKYLLYKNSELSNNNLDLGRLYVLTSDITASASEAVINCLIPYTGRSNIVIVGEKTFGKPYGSITIGTNEKYDWLLHPIAMRIYNANHESEYINGFEPDILIKELVAKNKMYPFGDTRDLLLAAAISRITGRTLKSSVVEGDEASSNLKLIQSSMDKKINGLIP